LREHQPEVTVVHAAGARFLTGDPIVMTAEDVVQVCRALPSTRVIAVHMEALNHCLLTRAELRERLRLEGLLDRVAIPADGETLTPWPPLPGEGEGEG
jgi:L-ascorbate metabolism protein UlaG (beta-lactamase superfamily)